MDLERLHRKYLDLGPYHFQQFEELTPDELKLLNQYGYWLAALERGIIPPITAAQERFLRVVAGSDEPASRFEIAWMKLIRLREAQAEAIRHRRRERKESGQVSAFPWPYWPDPREEKRREEEAQLRALQEAERAMYEAEKYDKNRKYEPRPTDDSVPRGAKHWMDDIPEWDFD
jgi:uncharacterized protein YifE (UPF0438 family)